MGEDLVTVTKTVPSTPQRDGIALKARKWRMDADEPKTTTSGTSPSHEPPSDTTDKEASKRKETDRADGEVQEKDAKRAKSEEPSPAGTATSSSFEPYPWECAFHVMRRGLIVNGYKDMPVDKIRATIVSHMQKNESSYKPFWDGKRPDHSDSACESWNAYLQVVTPS